MAFLRNMKKSNMQECDEVSLVIDPDRGMTPLPICIEIPGGQAHAVIPAGVRLPHETTQLFSTVDAHQLAAEFHLVAGSRPLVRDNIDIGRIRIRDVKWSGAGQPKLEIGFDFAKDGTLTIFAKNLDRKNTEMLAHLETDHIDARQIEAARKAAKTAEDHDRWVEACVDEMLESYALLDNAYERYAVAKKKMSMTQKRQYKAARKELQKALEVMPPEATEKSMGRLREAHKALDELYRTQKPLQDAVAKWYRR